MADDDLYEIARKRIDKRNRGWTLWAIDLGVLILSLALVALVGDTVAAAIFLAWGGVFTLHTILLLMAQSRDKAIESEVARLRAAVYEKPKRLELDEDGELAEVDDIEGLQDKRSRDSV